jgi:hypothetical protein
VAGRGPAVELHVLYESHLGFNHGFLSPFGMDDGIRHHVSRKPGRMSNSLIRGAAEYLRGYHVI